MLNESKFCNMPIECPSMDMVFDLSSIDDLAYYIRSILNITNSSIYKLSMLEEKAIIYLNSDSDNNGTTLNQTIEQLASQLKNPSIMHYRHSGLSNNNLIEVSVIN